MIVVPVAWPPLMTSLSAAGLIPPSWALKLSVALLPVMEFTVSVVKPPPLVGGAKLAEEARRLRLLTVELPVMVQVEP